MEKLSEKIKSKIGTKKTKPKWEFLALSALKDIAIAILWILSVLILGATIYIIINYNPWVGPLRNPKFFWPGVISLPWELIFKFIIVSAIVYWLSIKVNLLYRRKEILVIVLVVSLVAGYFIAEASGLNRSLSRLPMLKQMYQRQGRLFGQFRGPHLIAEITKIEDEKLEVKDLKEKIWQAEVEDSNFSASDYSTGEKIVIIGRKEKDKIIAFKIKKTDNLRGFNGLKKGPGKLRKERLNLY